MATVCLRIEGRAGEIPLQSLLTAIQNQISILGDLDTAVSREPQGTLDWLVTQVKTGSIEIVAESRSRLDDRNAGPEVARLYVGGLAQIEREGVTPPFFSESSMKSAKRLVGIIGRDGATGLLLSTPLLHEPAKLTSTASVNIDQLLPTRYQSFGSVEGDIEMISIHGKPRFVVYHARTRKAVTCVFEGTRWMEAVKAALGHRVNVSGVVHWNGRAEPVRVDVSDIRRLRSKADLPTAADIYGMAPDFTDGLDSVEYVRRLRVG